MRMKDLQRYQDAFEELRQGPPTSTPYKLDVRVKTRHLRTLCPGCPRQSPAGNWRSRAAGQSRSSNNKILITSKAIS
jgi:hypothetical protein